MPYKSLLLRSERPSIPRQAAGFPYRQHTHPRKDRGGLDGLIDLTDDFIPFSDTSGTRA